VPGDRATGLLVDYFVLGLVLEGSSYGYEIHKRLTERYQIGLGRSRTYQVLESLRDRGLIEATHVEASAVRGGRPRVHFRATEAGTVELGAWLARRMRDRESTESVGLTVRSSSVALRAMVEAVERDCIEDAAYLRSLPRSPEDPVGELLARELELGHGARMRWVEYARRLIG
jgi:DNA-binding PadR family transcriptional regulator